jgi:hypothetical protein
MLRRKPLLKKAKYAFVPYSCKLQVRNDKDEANKNSPALTSLDQFHVVSVIPIKLHAGVKNAARNMPHILHGQKYKGILEH